MGYQIPILKEYVSKYNAEVHVVHWDHKKLTSYSPPEIKGVFYYKRSEYDLKQLKIFVKNINPDIIYVSGWMDKAYLLSVRALKKSGICIVAGMDNIWTNSIKQLIFSKLFPFVKKLFFTHAWVAGTYQFEFARRIGFSKNEIISNCYSADILLFNNVFNKSKELKKKKYPHKFLFVGRFENIKGIDILLKSWQNLKSRNETKDWDLTFIGNGTKDKYLKKFDNIEVINFLQPDILKNEIKKYGCFILPSRSEPWGLVLHEFAAAGFPIICSNNCGAAHMFVVDNYNGHTFRTSESEALENNILKIINNTDDELFEKSLLSHGLGQRITPELSAATFLSVLE